MWIVAALGWVSAVAADESRHRVTSQRATVVAQDGTKLRTKTFRPRVEEAVPTIVTRSPYAIGFLLSRICRRFARRGFACVWQDVRGRGRSEGEWTPFVNEGRDGRDTMRWIREQPWSDGQVAWVGDSYLAGTGWAVLAEGGDPVTIVSRVFGPSLRETGFEGALFRHDVLTGWMVAVPSTEGGPLFKTRAFRRALRHRPRVTMDEAALGVPVPWFRRLADAAEPDDPFWRSGPGAPLEQVASRTDVPVFFVGGWSDPFLDAQARAWAELPRRADSLWVIGPWSHLGAAPAHLRLRNRKREGGLMQWERTFAWYEAAFRSGEPPETGVVSYVVGGGRWVHRDDWPPPTEARPWSLRPTADRCDGGLEEASRAPLPSPLTWTYDPANPLPSRGGAASLAGPVPFLRGTKPGFVRVRTKCKDRSDVLHFVAPPRDAPLHLAGTPKVEMRVASSAPDSAFGFRLLARPPRGRPLMIREGFTTLAEHHEGYEPGTPVGLTATSQPVELELPVGWSLELVLTSSSFPAVDAHPNVAGPTMAAEEVTIAEQTVFDATLVLPVVAPSQSADAE